jgi:large subunit ribosomal protein L35
LAAEPWAHALPSEPKVFYIPRFPKTAKPDGPVMPKQKTHKGTKKRFRLSAKGKAKHRQAGTSHLAARMSNKRKRNLRGTSVVDQTVTPAIQEALNGHSY